MSRTFFKILCVFLCAVVLISHCTALFCLAEEYDDNLPNITSEAAIIINADTGMVLFQKNADTPIYSGFLSRLMVCILLVESNADLDSDVKITSKMLQATAEKLLIQDESGKTVPVLKSGSTVSLRDLMKACLVANSQEAAVAIAMTLSDNLGEFIVKMKIKASELGAKQTKFTNVTGYSDSNNTDQTTTLHDIAVISAYASTLNYIQEYSDKSFTDITVSGVKRKLYTRNSLIDKNNTNFYNKKASGLAISGNSTLGYSISTIALKPATKDSQKINFVCACYNKNNIKTLYADTSELVNYSLKEFSPRSLVLANAPITEIPVKFGRQEWLTLYAENKISASLPSSVNIDSDVEIIYDIPAEITAPVTKGTVYGKVTYKYNGEVLGSTNLCAVASISQDSVALYTAQISAIFSNPFVSIFVISVLILVGAYSIVVYIKNKKNDRKKQLKNRTRVHPSITKK